ncbi:MAG: hypothetical protein WDM70_06290 [Nitrosomonadales bacterium]
MFQLIRGGRDPSLQIRPTLQVLQLLREYGQLTLETVAELSIAYVFLRNLEHRLQYLDDRQTQDLPENTDDHARLAEGMGYPDYPAMLDQLDQHRTRVSAHFAQIFSTRKDEQPEGTDPDKTTWQENMVADDMCVSLRKMGYSDTADLAQRLMQIRDSARYRQLPERSRQRMNILIPQFIVLCAAPDNRDQTLTRVLTLLESISRPRILSGISGGVPASVTTHCGYCQRQRMGVWLPDPISYPAGQVTRCARNLQHARLVRARPRPATTAGSMRN